MQQLLYEMLADFQQVYEYFPNRLLLFFYVPENRKEKQKKVTIGIFIIELIGDIKEKNRSQFN